MGWCGLMADLRGMTVGPDEGGSTAKDSCAAKDCPNLDGDVVQGGELIPPSLMDITSPAESKGLKP